ncbi:9506_t:CDS:2 [Funneliformis geosporum]|uniref:4477_t:CDS:1 n=1 Tax=Funneliformis geosporum TaxID=1117311 RepID=A0A9W4SWN6_9GLOM|nr:4477_t:CDS:2 [Funneliformis geosporum]CAI2181843.1 9506_t:CDS:2 [Funneliformis geosporum]
MFPSYIRCIRIILLLVIVFNNNLSIVKGQEPPFPFSIAQYIQITDSLATLRQILAYPGLIEVFTLLDGNASFTPTTGGQKITLFAPSNEALISSGIDLSNVEFMSNLIKYQTSPVAVHSKEIAPYLIVKTLLNDPLLVQLPAGEGQVLYLTKALGGDIITVGNGNLSAKVIKKDIECSNGVVHIIDAVIMPPVSLINTADNLALTQFTRAFTDANLLTDANIIKGVTIFAPTDDAFNKQNILAMDAKGKNSLLPLHIINTLVYDIKDDTSIQASNGEKLDFILKNEGGLNITIYVNNAKVERSVLLENGVMHVVNNVLLPLGQGGEVVHDDDDKKGPKDDKSNDKTKNNANINSEYKHTDKKLVIGAVLGGVCGGIVVTLSSCMLYKWFRAQKNSKFNSPTPVHLKSNA